MTKIYNNKSETIVHLYVNKLLYQTALGLVSNDQEHRLYLTD